MSKAWLLLFGILPLQLVEAAATVTETPEALTASTSNYTIRVAKNPYALSVVVGDREILAHGRGGGSQLVMAGASRRLNAVTGWQATGETLFLTVASEDGPAIALTLGLATSHIEVSWTLAGGAVADRIEEAFPLAAGRHWYGGNVTSGHQWPLETGESNFDPFLGTSNQATPVWLASSGAGIFLPAYEQMGFSLQRGRDGLLRFHVKNASRLSYYILAGRNIVEAYRAFIALAGKPDVVPPKEYFTEPIFNTWIEYMTKVSQSGMETYMRKIRESGFPATVLMLDDGWLSKYGDNRFDAAKFPAPRKMIDEAHRLGFRIVLWEVPFVEKASANFERLERQRWLVLDATGKAPAIVKWWDGEAALVDLSNPAAYEWYLGELRWLQREYGVDGYKLDAGDAEYFDPKFVTYGGITPNRYTDLWAGMGRHFEINELRVSWLAQPWGLVQRLRDKGSDWTVDAGLGSIVRHGLTESIIGYPYWCPDIIGGGLESSFLDKGYRMDEELYIRWAQASALMPMMQFSYAPWRLSPKSQEIVKRYALLHKELGPYIYKLAVEAKADGTPIVRPLFFRNPEDEKTYTAEDEFLLGDRFLVAPVLKKGAAARDIYLPAGMWKDFWSSRIYQGGQTVANYSAPLEVLPVFVSID